MNDFTADPLGLRDQGRELMADAIDTYINRVDECRSYDLADHLIRKLNQSGWWFVWGADIERAIAQEHPFNVQAMKRRRERQIGAVERIANQWMDRALAAEARANAAEKERDELSQFYAEATADLNAAEATIATLTTQLAAAEKVCEAAEGERDTLLEINHGLLRLLEAIVDAPTWSEAVDMARAELEGDRS